MRWLASLLLLIPLSRSLPAQQDAQLFRASAAVVSTAVLLDVTSTLVALRVCKVCRETNPIAAPFISGGIIPSVLMAASFTSLALVLTNELRKHDQSGKHFWVTAPLLLAVAHILATEQNVKNILAYRESK